MGSPQNSVDEVMLKSATRTGGTTKRPPKSAPVAGAGRPGAALVE
jgi:hypothetical protein